MQKTKWIMLLLIGVIMTTGICACGGSDSDEVDQNNPQVGTWMAEREDMDAGASLRMTQTITLSKSGAYRMEAKLFVTCKTQDAVDWYNNYYDISAKLNEEIEAGVVSEEGYYTWDNEKKTAKVTLEKMSYSGSSNFTLTFTFTPDFNAAKIKGGYIEDLLFKRQ